MNDICVIGVYFGKLPEYFPLWLKSCSRNLSVDFLIFTDQTVDQLPENVHCHPMCLPEIKQRAENVLGFPVCLEKPYKCCDFKPLYGLIFRDYISEYQYWGHCDFDMIFGDLQCFFTEYGVRSYDRFLPLGHLSFYRNTEEVNNRFRCTGGLVDYQTVYTSDKNFAFDEIPGMTKIYLENYFSIFTKRIFADIASVYRRYRIIEEYTLDEKAENYPHQIFYWEKGKVYRAYYKENQLYTEEYIYIHFIPCKITIIHKVANIMYTFFVKPFKKRREISLYRNSLE